MTYHFVEMRCPRVNVVVTLEEAKRRIRELGLPMLELEGDYEDAGKAGD